MTMNCPVCGYQALNQRALGQHFRARRNDVPHQEYKKEYKTRNPFEGQKEDIDFVRCRICNKPAISLCRHLQKKHCLDILQYREQYGKDVLTRGTVASKKASDARKGKPSTVRGKTKFLTCENCSNQYEVSLFYSITGRKLLCPSCKTTQTKTKNYEKIQSFEGKSEPEDYVTCLVCGHHSASLASHIQWKHPNIPTRYQEIFPGAPILCNSIRRKIGKSSSEWPRSETWKRKMSTIFRTRFTIEDFNPFLDPDGTLDHHTAATKLGVGLHIIKRNAEELNLRVTRRYSLGRADYKKIILTLDDLEPFKLKNGKIAAGKAAQVLGYNHLTILKNCERLGLPVAHRAISQELFLDAVSRVLGGATYIQKWNPPGFINPKTGGRFRFDGYFPDYNLLAEFYGFAHYMYPNPYNRTIGDYQKALERDRVKQALTTGKYLLLIVRQNEPWDDLGFIRGRLALIGLTCPETT